MLTSAPYVCYDTDVHKKAAAQAAVRKRAAPIKHLFDPGNMLFSSLARIVDIVGLSLLWVLLCIPVVTIGPATSALYYACYHAFRQGDSKAFGRFFHSLRLNLKQGILSTVILLPVFILLYGLSQWYGLALDAQAVGSTVGYGFFYVLLLIPMGLACWLFPLLARFEFSTGALFSTAFRLLLAHLPTTLFITLLAAAALLLSIQFLPLFLFAPAIWAILSSLPLERAFARHMPHAEDSAPPAGDET